MEKVDTCRSVQQKHDNCSHKKSLQLAILIVGGCLSLSMSSHLLETKKSRTPDTLSKTNSKFAPKNGWLEYCTCRVRALLVSTKACDSKLWKSIIFPGKASLVNVWGSIPWVVLRS